MEIKSERLILRKFEESDTERMFLLDSNPEVMKYIGIPPVSDISESENIIKMIRQQYTDNGVGRLAVIEKKSGLLIGWSGLKLLTQEINGYNNVYDLGYRFLPEYWGRGYAFESAKASLEFGFNDLKTDTIYAHAHSENEGSNYILRKLGFEKTGEFTEPDGICFWYELKRNKFL
ncbi:MULTISPECIES: GNAT family N-acetyltransferase [Chryseobacterium]|uniref:RimJ/RimL family protein N-acetyltransferase n=1 Tax=Chryseobacterium geocarposphaerae TaxID=1416776 RepID=A0ABU1LII4_9FLAO|nr:MULTISPECIES: GNAT family N-acetyltransferase [Chryseobacterium]MDR6406517.1 RimJ/RimL family protein N-acetyltransferase [Chryseobacterium geocarposphaerae]MDR6699984.1 RimJ/RimL family protein N-acetyltransferase [Chryseobacterium ginsenosidimutans]